MSSDITPELLLHAYASGIFPMADSAQDTEIFWVDPTWRGVIPLDQFHISRSLKRAIRSADYNILVDQNFLQTVELCADRPETWINQTIFDLYSQLHTLGFAHSLEVWRENKMIGGVYGVSIGGAFFGESMFSKATNGSKIALSYLVHRLNAGGYKLLDTQFITPHLASLGGIEIARKDYQSKLSHALELSADFLLPQTPSPTELLSQKTSFLV